MSNKIAEPALFRRETRPAEEHHRHTTRHLARFPMIFAAWLLLACGEAAASDATRADAAADHEAGSDPSGAGGAGNGGGGSGALGDGGCTNAAGGAVPCAEAGAECENNPGCHAQQLCVPNQCDVFSASTCDGQPGCAWDADAGACVPPSCGAFDAGNCSADAGCYVTAVCEGKPEACEDLVTCAYPGCSWLL